MDMELQNFVVGFLEKQAESEAMTKAKGKFDPSYWQLLPFVEGKAYENVGRARAVLDVNDEEVPFYLRKPKTAVLGALLSGGILGGVTGGAIGGKAGAEADADWNHDSQVFGAFTGGALGALTGAVGTLALAIKKSKEVKQRMADKDLQSKVSNKGISELEHVDTLKNRNKLLNGILGFSTGSYDAGFADQLKTMSGDTSGAARPFSGYAANIIPFLNAVNQNAAQNALRGSK